MFQAEGTASAKAQRLFELKEVTLWKGNGPGGIGHTHNRGRSRAKHTECSSMTSLGLNFPICA